MDWNALIDAYCACWQDLPAEARLARMAEILTADIRYTDPTVDVSGLEAFAAHIERTVSARPGSRIRRTTAIDAHHGLARFGWHLVQADGKPLPDGIDIVRAEEAGGRPRLFRIVGFFGPLKPLD